MTQAPAQPTPHGDEVDRITAAWHRERPDLDVTPLQVVSRVTRLARHLDLARRDAFAAHDLDSWEFDVLAALRRSGEPYSLSAGQLGAETLVTSGTMTNRIDRLEQRGLVRREPDPADRRGVRVVLTEAGRRTVDNAMADLVSREHEILDVLSAGRQAELADLLRTLVRSFGD
ncbi:MAG: MarR family transcriptional regulator [Actinomycetales bacterium]|nr:MarR family transcriptional regulator [Actinomycetales bacterium]